MRDHYTVTENNEIFMLDLQIQAIRSRSKHILQWRYYTAMKYQFIHSFIQGHFFVTFHISVCIRAIGKISNLEHIY